MDELVGLEQSIAQQDEGGLEAGLDYMDAYEDEDEDEEEDDIPRSDDHGKWGRRRQRKSSSVGYGTRFVPGLSYKYDTIHI